MTLIFDPSKSSKVKSDGANQKPVDPTYKCSQGFNLVYVTALRYFESKDYAVDFGPWVIRGQM